MRATTKLAVLAAACVALSSSGVGADISFSTTDLSGAGNAGVVASDAGTGKTPCPSLPQAAGVAGSTTTDTAPPAATEAPVATETPATEAPISTEAPAAIEDPAFTESPTATEMPVATEAATEVPAAITIAKTPCPSLAQPSLSSSSSGESSGNSSGKSPCPSLQTASTSSDGSVSAPCPSLKVKTPCPSLSTASKSSSEDAASGSSDAVEVVISGLTVAVVSASALLLL
ncbi:hypothetical protein F442_19920 [Phytophthora nicotianae P10297]|uniref:Uncharacterized protein n=1 Tax=Phytophthora nicotianae P10297 TaxID=1317064 RepID=W2Y9B9_PHYNI|nr:hypothetical protein F442_19920 [Phytophthora nicotianae P10297]